MPNHKKQAKFQVEDMLGIGMTIVVFAIGVGYGINVLADTRDEFLTSTDGCNATDVDACGSDYNASAVGITGVAKLPAKLPLIVTIVVAAIVIGILVRYLAFNFR